MAETPTAEREPDEALSEGWEQRQYRTGDEEGLLELLTAGFGRWPGVDIDVPAIDHLRWKLLSRGAQNWHQLITIDGRIAGGRSHLRQRIKVGDRVLRSVQPVDNAVHPAYRKLGVMDYLRRVEHAQLAETVDVRFNVRSASAAISRLREKYAGETVQLANRTEVLTNYPGVLADGSSWAIRLARGLPLFLRRLGYALLDRQSNDVSYAIQAAARFDERVDALWQEAAAEFAFIVERTKDYLNCRFADPRAGAFTIRLAEEDGRLLGYSVLRVSGGRGYVADLLTLPHRPDVVRSLLRDGPAYFRDTGVEAVDCWTQAHHPYRATLRRLGFLHRRWTIALACLLFSSPDGLDFARSRRAPIHVMAGDTDLI